MAKGKHSAEGGKAFGWNSKPPAVHETEAPFVGPNPKPKCEYDLPRTIGSQPPADKLKDTYTKIPGDGIVEG
jgi:hypothetical protein